MNDRIKSILSHMLDDALDVVEFVGQTGSSEAFCQNNMVRKAVVMSLLNIGELANHLPSEYTDAHQDVPWRRMIGMRNIAAHGYHVMSLEIIWETAQTFVPNLLKFLRSQLSE